MTLPAWCPDERAHAGPEHLDPEYVSGYDVKAGVDVSEDVGLLGRHGLGPETTLVDLGAGTGSLALAAASHCRRVGAAGVENVDLVEAGFLTYAHAGDPPGLVHTRNALHHLPDFWKALALVRVHELLVPGGTLLLRDLVYSFEPGDAYERIDAWLAGAAPNAAEGWTRAELEEHVRREQSTFAWLLEPMLEHAGFEIHDVSHRGGVYATYVCVAR